MKLTHIGLIENDRLGDGKLFAAIGNASRRQDGSELEAGGNSIDKAAAAGVIHKNQAANRKSRLMKRVAKLEAAEA